MGTGASGTTATEFRARFEQTGPTGEHFIAFGYVTNAQGLSENDLFAGTPLSDTTALLTAYAEGELYDGRSIKACTRSTSRAR